MKNLLYLLLILSVGCTQSKNGSNPTTPQESPADIEVAISDSQTVGNEVTATADDLIENILNSTYDLDYGQVVPGQSILKVVRIRNTSNTPRIITIEGVTAPFQLFFNRCQGKSLRKGEACDVQFRMIANPQIVNGAITPVEISLKYGTGPLENIPLLLKAEMTGSVNASNQWLIEAYMSQEGFNGSFSLGQSLGIRTLYIKNKGLTPAPMSALSPSINSDYKILINRCTGSLQPAQQCSILLFYTKYREAAPASERSVFVYTKNSENELQGYNVYSKVLQTPPSDTYTAVYTQFPPNTLQACQGQLTVTRSIQSCTRDSDSAVVDNSFCSPPVPASQVYLSPSGNGNPLSISGGTRFEVCAIGQTSSTNYAYTCNSTHELNGTGDGCSPLNNAGSYAFQTLGSHRTESNGYIVQGNLNDGAITYHQSNGYIIYQGEFE